MDQILVGAKDAGYDGNENSRTGASKPIRIAILEADSPDNDLILRNHVGWQDTAGGEVRVKKVYRCTSSRCTKTSATGSKNSHGNVVAWVAAGSIEQGQDPVYTRTSARKDRSGIASEAEIHYYLFSADITSGTAALRRAINKAVANGADVINMSFGGERCDSVDTTTYDASSLNSTLAAAMVAGALPVSAAGNDGYQQGVCSVTYPAWRPHVLAVTALHTTSDYPDMNTTIMYGHASRGGATIGFADTSYESKAAVIGLAAPGGVSYFFCGEPASYCTYLCSWWEDVGNGECNDVMATSYATPVVSGSAALMRDAFNELGWWGGANDAGALLVNMLVLGDAWQGDPYNAFYGYDMKTGISEVSGFGRLHAHWPGSDNLSGPWGWGWRKSFIREGETIAWHVGSSSPESLNVTQWKWALTWFEQDMANMSNVVICARDACNNNEPIACDLSNDFRKRIQLRSGEVAGRCLYMWVWATVTPSTGVWLYSADYYHSGNPNDH